MRWTSGADDEGTGWALLSDFSFVVLDGEVTVSTGFEWKFYRGARKRVVCEGSSWSKGGDGRDAVSREREEEEEKGKRRPRTCLFREPRRTLAKLIQFLLTSSLTRSWESSLAQVSLMTLSLLIGLGTEEERDCYEGK